MSRSFHIGQRRRRMKRLLGFAIGAFVLMAAGAAVAAPPGPGQKFDCSQGGSGISCASDDTGCVPQSKDVPTGNVSTLKCGDGLSKAFAGAIRAVIKCHAKMASSVLKGAPVDDEVCESNDPVKHKSAKEKLDAAILKITPLCTSTQLTLAAAQESTLFASKTNPLSLDAQAGAVYCDGSTSIDPGGDDAGTISTTDPVNDGNRLKCANTVGSELGKLVAAAIKCHIKLADSDFGVKDFDENVCEENDPVKGKSALQKYNAAMTKLTANGTCSANTCLTAGNRTALGTNILAQVEAANALFYPCPVPGACTCAGGTPTQTSFTTGIGSGTCGHLDADGSPNFFTLACGGLYFGGANVGVPLPSKIPDQGSSLTQVSSCSGNTLTLAGATAAQAAGGSPPNNRCVQGLTTKLNTACLVNSDCASTCATVADCSPGATTCTGGACSNAKCAQTKCTNTGCLFGPPLPIPNSSHTGAATSTCVLNTITASAAGSADCNAGSVTNLSLPLSSGIFLTGDLMPMRCSGGTTPGANCTGGGGCGTTLACGGVGTCVNDTGRCRAPDAANTPCCSDGDCPGSGTCETGACVAGASANLGCITDADCPSSTCRTFIQTCPICNSTTNKCNAGINDTLSCTPGDSGIDGDYPTSHDCPPPPASGLGALPIAFVLNTGTVTKTAVDLPDQVNVFCAFCKNKALNSFARRCGGTTGGTVCTGNTGTTGAPCSVASPCLPIPCTADGDCSSLTVGAFTHCRQNGAGGGGAFSSLDIARTIVETGSPAGPLTTGGPALPAKLVSIFCIPGTFNTLVDSAANIPGPGAVALQGTAQNLP